MFKLNRRVTGALAWSGLIVILAVPSVEVISAKVAGPAGPGASVDPVKTATVTTRDPVADYQSTGKPLPSYISEGTQPAPRRIVPTPGTVAPATASTTPVAPAKVPAAPAAAKPTPPATQVAALPPATAPVPMPAWMRPKAAAVPPPVVASEEAPLILDEALVTGSTRRAVAPAPGSPVPPADVPVVGEDALGDWTSGTLADYLARRNLLSDASYGNDYDYPESAPTYDPDGFYLSDGPNTERRPYRRRGDSFVVFSDD